MAEPKPKDSDSQAYPGLQGVAPAQVLNGLPVAIAILSSQGRIDFVNERFVAVFGYTLQDIPTIQAWWERAYPEPSERAKNQKFWQDKTWFWEQETTSNRLLRNESRVVCKDGRVRDVVLQGTKFCGRGLIIILDVSDLRKAEEELRRQRRDYEMIVNLVPAQIWRKDLHNHFLWVNPQVAKDLGMPAEFIAGKSAEELFPAYAQQYFEDDQEVFRSGKPKLGIVEPVNTASGEVRWVRTDKVPYEDDKGSVLGLLAFVQDITDQKRAEESLNLTQFIIDRATQGVSWYKLDGTCLYANEAACRLMGRQRAEVLGRHKWEVDPAESSSSWQALVEQLPAGESAVQESSVALPGGERRIIEVFASRLDVAGQQLIVHVAHDITERRETELQLQQAQKMEAVGTLAGGIAHDFNNLLTGIIGNSQLLAFEPNLSKESLEAVHAIEAAGLRAASLMEKLMSFARRGRGPRQVVDLHAVVLEVIGLFRRTVSKDIRLESSLQARRSLVRGDPGQLQQLLLNLALNARDAMPHGGVLRFETQQEEGEDGEPKVDLVVSDTGPGVPPELRSRVFEPFFTTKPPGQGTGLGLAVVYSIVRSHGGTVRVEGEPGQGARFVVSLPQASIEPPAVPASTQRPLSSGTGHVLVVDDEPIVRETSAALLERLGYRVSKAASGPEAIALFESSPVRVDLVLLDMVMPEMDGRACFRALRALRPDVPVILCSGYDRDGRVEEVLAEGGEGFVQKPLRLEALAETVAGVLAKQRAVQTSAVPSGQANGR